MMIEVACKYYQYYCPSSKLERGEQLLYQRISSCCSCQSGAVSSVFLHLPQPRSH